MVNNKTLKTEILVYNIRAGLSLMQALGKVIKAQFHFFVSCFLRYDPFPHFDFNFKLYVWSLFPHRPQALCLAFLMVNPVLSNMRTRWFICVFNRLIILTYGLFHQLFTSSSFVQKCFQQLFCNCSLRFRLYFLAKNILAAQQLLEKCG